VLALCDRFSEKGFAPALDSPDRAFYFQWHCFAASTMEMAFATYAATRGAAPEVRAAELEKIRQEKVPEMVAMLEKRLKHHEFLVGSSFTSADILVTSTLPYGEKVLLEKSKILQDYWKRMSERPAAKRAKLFT
jgi:glutathione S-transferase